jgi:hypothetical protein
LRELFLLGDRVGWITRRAAFARVQDGRDQVSQAFADTGARFDGQVLAVLQCARHRHRHLLLLWPELEVARTRQQAGRRKDLLDLLDEVDFRTSRLSLDGADH